MPSTYPEAATDIVFVTSGTSHSCLPAPSSHSFPLLTPAVNAAYLNFRKHKAAWYSHSASKDLAMRNKLFKPSSSKNTAWFSRLLNKLATARVASRCTSKWRLRMRKTKKCMDCSYTMLGWASTSSAMFAKAPQAWRDTSMSGDCAKLTWRDQKGNRRGTTKRHREWSVDRGKYQW